MIKEDTITVSITTDLDLIKSIITHKDLWSLTGGQDKTLNPDTFVPDMSYAYIIAYNNDKPAALGQIKYFTKVTLETHAHVLPEFQKERLTVELCNKMIEFVKQNSSAQKLLVTTPNICRHVTILLNKLGFKQFGSLSNSIIYNDKLVDLLFYEYNLRD